MSGCRGGGVGVGVSGCRGRGVGLRGGGVSWIVCVEVGGGAHAPSLALRHPSFKLWNHRSRDCSGT